MITFAVRYMFISSAQVYKQKVNDSRESRLLENRVLDVVVFLFMNISLSIADRSSMKNLCFGSTTVCSISLPLIAQ